MDLLKYCYSVLKFNASEEQRKNDFRKLTTLLDQEDITNITEFENDSEVLENYNLGFSFHTKEKDHESSLVFWDPKFISKYIKDKDFKKVMAYCEEKKASLETISKLNIIFNEIKFNMENENKDIKTLDDYVYSKEQ